MPNLDKYLSDKDLLPKPCIKCVKLCIKNKGVTSCVAYEQESYHWHRMVEDCPLIIKTLDNIFGNIIIHAKAELTKHNVPITE